MSTTAARIALLLTWPALACGAGAGPRGLLAELKASGLRILHETCRNGNWELVVRNADGSKPVNLTRTPHVDELYPKASPDGRHVAFVAVEGAGKRRSRSVYYTGLDGGERILVAPHGRQPFWSPGGSSIAFTMGAKPTAPEGGYASKGLFFYSIETRTLTEAPRTDVAGLLAPGFSPDGQWVVASVARAMGLDHAIVAFRPQGRETIPLARAHWEHGRPLKNIYQCRPDISPDGTRIAWGKDDVDNRLGLGRRSMYIEVAPIDLEAPDPRAGRATHPVRIRWPRQVSHVDWSPDGRYLAFSQGPADVGRVGGAHHILGKKAPGWDIHVVAVEAPHVVVQITHDGQSNKEPDWVPVAPAKGRSRQ